MILVIPKIEIESGRCKSTVADYSENTSLYSKLAEKPQEYIKLLRKENSKSVYILDYDSFLGNPINFSTIGFICKNTDIPIQLKAKISDFNEFKQLASLGIRKFIFPYFDKHNIDLYYACRALNNNIGLSFKISIDELIERKSEVLDLALNRIYLHNSSYELSDLAELITANFNKLPIKFTLLENIRTHKDLIFINKNYSRIIDSVVIGNAIYENAFPCQKIWREVEILEEV
jgi:phosphoribosylformimino-5-aminoimidazole carboxamide ribonucleotide (ProFAR) isomerase